jgi:hypothetical protein
MRTRPNRALRTGLRFARCFGFHAPTYENNVVAILLPDFGSRSDLLLPLPMRPLLHLLREFASPNRAYAANSGSAGATPESLIR